MRRKASAERWLIEQYKDYLEEEGLMDPEALDAAVGPVEPTQDSALAVYVTNPTLPASLPNRNPSATDCCNTPS